jgi:DNA repair exonuclease SbcCD ATPase subunit
VSFVRLLSCNPTGLYSYGQHQTIPLDRQGVVYLTGINHDRKGDAIAAGKSSILNIICRVLFGQDNHEEAMDGSVVNSVWDHGCFAVVKFAVNDQKFYRVAMVRDWEGDPPEDMSPSDLLDRGDKYEGKDIYFDEYVGNYWIDRRAGTMKDTRAAIRQAIGMNYEQFCSLAYLAQSRGLRFVDGKHKDRAQIFSDLQDLSIWDVANKQASIKVSVISQELDALNTVIATTKQHLEMLKIPTVEEIAKLEAEYETVDKQTREMTAWSITNDTFIQNSIQQSSALRLQVLKEEACITSAEAGKEKAHNSLMGYILQLDSPQTVSEDVTRLGLLHQAARIAITNTQSLLIKTKTELGAFCQYCGTTVTDESKKQYQASLNRQLMGEEFEMDRLAGELENAKQIHNAKQAEATKLHTELAEKANQQTEQYLAEVDYVLGQHRATISALKAQIAALDLAAHQATISGSSVRAGLRELERKADVLEATIRQAKHASDAHRGMTAELLKSEAAAKDLAIEREYWSALAKHFGNSGIKAHKFGALVGTLEQLCRKYVSQLTDDAVQVSFSPFRERTNAKSADDVVADFQIFVKEGAKDAVDIKLYSGGESQQIIVAIICGFAKLASLQGGGVNALFLDEIFSMLNGTSKAAMVDLVSDLRASNNGTVVVITHDLEVQKTLDCDQIWTAVKKNHITTLEMVKAV